MADNRPIRTLVSSTVSAAVSSAVRSTEYPHGPGASIQDLPVSTTDVFSLGNVQPADQVIVYAWTLSRATEEVAKKITLTHDLGAGRVLLTR